MAESALERLIEAAKEFLGTVIDGVTKPGDILLFSDAIEDAEAEQFDGKVCE